MVTANVSRDATSGLISVAAANACGLGPAATTWLDIQSCPVKAALDTLSACPGAQVAMPVFMERFYDVGAISLLLQYDTANLEYLGFQNIHPEVQPLDVTIDPGAPSIITISSNIPFGCDIPDGEVLLELLFTVHGGPASLEWITSSTQQSYCKDVCGEMLPAAFSNGLVLMGNPLVQLQGYVQYANTIQTGLPDVLINVKKDGAIITQATTDSSGFYKVTDLCPGVYSLEVTYALPWGGANAADALLILKHFVGMGLLNMIFLDAAETDNSGYINSSDALSVMKRFTGLVNAFPAGDWVFEKKTISIAGEGIYQLNIRGLCVGDVNASYVP